MKKLLVVLVCMSSMYVFADTPVTASTPNSDSANCQALRAQVKSSRQALKQAFKANDACKIGKIELANHALIKSNLACFPKIKEKMEQHNMM